MQSIIVITSPNTTLKSFADKLGLYYEVDIVAEDRIVIDDGEKYIAVNLDDDVNQEYDAEELNIISQRIKQPRFFLIEFSHLDFLTAVIPFCVDDPEFLIDTDHGDILSGREFLLKLKKHPWWDWRTDVVIDSYPSGLSFDGKACT